MMIICMNVFFWRQERARTCAENAISMLVIFFLQVEAVSEYPQPCASRNAERGFTRCYGGTAILTEKVRSPPHSSRHLAWSRTFPAHISGKQVAILHLSHSAPRGSSDRNTTAKLIAGGCNLIKTQRPVPQTRHFLFLQHESGADSTSFAHISDMCNLSRSLVLVAISRKPRDGTTNSTVICISYLGTF